MITRDELRDLLSRSDASLGLLQQHNPAVRHIVLRRRKSLEEAGLMKPVAVEIHPKDVEPDRRSRAFFGPSGRAVETSMTLRAAFEEAERFTKELMARNKGAGMMRSLLLQRICSSTTAGLSTARVLGNADPDDRAALLGALAGEEDLLPAMKPPSRN